ncbi:MAG: GTP-binding protein, partial [Malacoplasma sp.]|nr:GTP-binding protein [Malacoplasma sp.]
NIDYPEYEDLEIVTLDSFKKEIKKIIEKINSVIISYKKISYLYKGINVAIIGEPNAGKSSLLNAILKKDKAIVSSIKGTTRDLVNESVNLDGILLNFIDTAGIRKAKNEIEKIGIKKTLETINESDFIIFLIDSSKSINIQEKEILKFIANKNYVVVKNKSDLGIDANPDLDGIRISALKKDINELIIKLKSCFKKEDFNLANNLSICSDNELQIVKEIFVILKRSYENALNNFPLDLLVEDLTLAYKKICTIMGLEKDLNIIDKMFKNFCLGK